MAVEQRRVGISSRRQSNIVPLPPCRRYLFSRRGEVHVAGLSGGVCQRQVGSPGPDQGCCRPPRIPRTRRYVSGRGCTQNASCLDRESLPRMQPYGCPVEGIPFSGLGRFATRAQVTEGAPLKSPLSRFGFHGKDAIKELRSPRPACFACSVRGKDSRGTP